MKQKLIYWLPLLLLVGCSQPTYKTTSLAPEKRAELLLKELTLEEKVALMMDNSQAVERLGIKPYNWWNEALHGVARAGLATVFPQPIGMAASFSPESVYEVFSAVSDEARAKNANYASQGSYARYQGLTMWTPTVNIYRDPRWGRGIETYGEDPYLTSRMGVMVVKGLQGTNDGKYDKLHACAKHFAVHSGPEWNRHSFNVEDLSARDLYETYLPPFEALVKEAKVKEVTDGTPSAHSGGHYAAIFWTGDRDYELPATIELQSIVGLSQRNDPWTITNLFDDETNATGETDVTGARIEGEGEDRVIRGTIPAHGVLWFALDPR